MAPSFFFLLLLFRLNTVAVDGTKFGFPQVFLPEAPGFDSEMWGWGVPWILIAVEQGAQYFFLHFITKLITGLICTALIMSNFTHPQIELEARL